MVNDDDLDPRDAEPATPGRPHAPAGATIDIQERVTAGWSPSPIVTDADGGPTPTAAAPLKVLRDDDWLCLKGPCRNYHRMVTTLEATTPLDGSPLVGEDGHEPRAVVHTCYPAPGIETPLNEVVVYECNRWDPIVRSHPEDRAREDRRAEYEQGNLEPADDVDDVDGTQNLDADGLPAQAYAGGVLGEHAAFKPMQVMERRLVHGELAPEAENVVIGFEMARVVEEDSRADTDWYEIVNQPADPLSAFDRHYYKFESTEGITWHVVASSLFEAVDIIEDDPLFREQRDFHCSALTEEEARKIVVSADDEMPPLLAPLALEITPTLADVALGNYVTNAI